MPWEETIMEGIRAALRRLRTLAAVRTASALGDAELLGRFADAHDEAAFTALVERHGPMVLRVCRRILGHAQDAEDACQATFLVLARKAGSVRKRASAASWLFGVASRTARKLRANRARNESGCARHTEAEPATEDDPSWREVRAVLDDELLRLPEKYRDPLVLCYLEGLTRDEAARRLGLGLNRLRSRLDYGRGLLRARLTRRGVGLSAVLFAGLLAREASAVPAVLAVITGRAAALFAAGRALPAGLVAARVSALAERMVHAMLVVRLNLACAAVLLVAGFGVVVSAAGQAAPPAPLAAPAGAPAGKPPRDPVAEHPLNKSLQGLKAHYALKDGEVLKSFRPPLPEARKAFFRVARPPGSELEWDGSLTLYWKGDRLEFGWVDFGMPPRGQALEFLLYPLAGLHREEVEGDRTLRWNTLIAGDFVVRAGAPAAKVVARLEEILNKEHGIPVRLTLGEADRTVYVLEGAYRHTPAAAGRPEHHIDLYAKELVDFPAPPGAKNPFGGCRGNFAEFVNQLGRFVDRRVVLGKATGLPAQVTWTEHFAEPFPQGATPEQWEAAHAAGPALKNIARQTGLTVREETRRVRVLTVQRK